MARLFTLPQPEAGAEHGVYWQLNHNCSQGKALRRALDDDNVDLIVFPVGQTGYGMPQGVPFEVVAVEPCNACGALLRTWFEWQKKIVVA